MLLCEGGERRLIEQFQQDVDFSLGSRGFYSNTSTNQAAPALGS